MPTPTPENDNATASRTDKAVVCDALVLLPWSEGWWWTRYCADWRNRDPWVPVEVQRHHRTGKLEVRWQGNLTFSPMPERDYQWAPMSQPPPVDWQNNKITNAPASGE